MSPSQFQYYKNHAKEKLNAIMASIRRIKLERSAREAKLRLVRDQALMSSWCINFAFFPADMLRWVKTTGILSTTASD